MHLPVTVTIITYAPTTFYHCQHCEVAFTEVGLGERLRRQEAADALPEDLAREFAQLSDWVRAIVERHGPRVHLDVLDAVSIRGVLASLRHGISRYPAVIVDGRPMSLRTPDEFRQADSTIDRRLAVVAA
jgi:hypothetical protein